MCRARRYSDREFKKILRDNGYSFLRGSGDHLIYSNGKNKITIKKNLNHMIILRLIKENNLITD